ncbi:MAG: sterol 3beta-glucosyltransferase [Neolewinella sp.]|jgi:sterol 3beta-glucosyltransferase
MKFLLLSIGTRGDAEPFLAVGDLLQRAGHEVVIALPAQFRHLADDAGLDFEPLDKRFLELLEGQTARGFMGQKGSWLKRLLQLARLAKTSLVVQKEIIREQRDLLVRLVPDRVIYHPKCLVARVSGMSSPEKAICLSLVPNMMYPERRYPHIGIPIDLGGWGNLQSYTLVNRITARMVTKYVKPFATDFPGVAINTRAVYDHMLKRERTLYPISPTLYPRPGHWPEHAKVMGYFERPKTSNWAPPTKLTDFLTRFEKENITFITFGSMVNAAPQATTKAIMDVLEKHQIPAIINTSSGGLIRPDQTPEHVHFVERIPYESIFPKIHSVVHHGGSGTTHTAVKHGCASLIFPHIIDQFFWNRRIAELGVGPLGVKIKHLSADTFERLLLDLRNHEAYSTKAYLLAQKMNGEANPRTLVAELLR